MRRLLIISLCLLGFGVLLLWVLRASRPSAAGTDEPQREPYAEPEPVVEAEPEPVVEAEPEPVAEAEPEHVAEAEPEHVAEAEPVAEAGQDTEQIPVIDLPDEAVVAPSGQGEGQQRMAQMAELRAEIVERVERRPLFVMAEERNVPYFRLFFMTKPELLDAILEVEHVPPHDVMPSQDALDRVREIADEAYRRHEEIAAEEAVAAQDQASA
jgi:hypothetical protein